MALYLFLCMMFVDAYIENGRGPFPRFWKILSPFLPGKRKKNCTPLDQSLVHLDQILLLVLFLLKYYSAF